MVPIISGFIRFNVLFIQEPNSLLTKQRNEEIFLSDPYYSVSIGKLERCLEVSYPAVAPS
jgi:hypothetical protein